MSLKKIGLAISKTIQAILIILIIATLAIALISRKDGIVGYKSFVLSTGSMSPTMPAGSLVIIKPQSTYQKDDVITFYTNDQNGVRQILPTTHRIFEVKTGENLGYQTKGDANNTADPFITPHASVIGKVLFHLPFIGNFSDFARSRNGLTYLIIIPATIIVYQELMNIKTELSVLLAARKEKEPHPIIPPKEKKSSKK